MPKKFYISLCTILFFFLIFVFQIFNLSVKKREFYFNKYQQISEVYTRGETAPRGRILDINGKVIVDNIGVNTIYYHKSRGSSLANEIEISKKLVLLTNYQYNYKEGILKDYYLLLYPKKVEEKISEEEWKNYQERRMSKEDFYELKKEKITKEMLDELSALEKYSSYFYYLMNDGYSYQNKLLLKDIDDSIYAKILEEKLNGIFGEIDWKRNYYYGDSMKSILGYISKDLPREKIDLLKKGYTYQDQVGISGLEEYYEEYLKGEKAVYKVHQDNSLELVSEAKRGNDLVLEIDMDMQVKIEDIVKNEILKAKKTSNTEFFKESYALVSDPSSGALRSVVGVRYIEKTNSFQDVSIEVIKNAYQMGSAVKAASMSVGYLEHAIDIGTSMVDSCVKLYNVPVKCSYSPLGRVNDITALTHSSNYYQFIIALKVAGYQYHYDMKANVTLDDFQKYRTIYAQYGLGSKTGIDLNGEITGLKGEKIAPDLLMNLAIGQYDLYTPISMIQYANTLANKGMRLKLHLMHQIQDKDFIIKEYETEVLNQILIDEKYKKRIEEGLMDVMKHGTGYYYASPTLHAAGKTGTSEALIDADYNGTLESYVINNTFFMYAPVENPKYSMVVISPNTSNLRGKSSYRSPVNRLIAKSINDYLFTSS